VTSLLERAESVRKKLGQRRAEVVSLAEADALGTAIARLQKCEAQVLRIHSIVRAVNSRTAPDHAVSDAPVFDQNLVQRMKSRERECMDPPAEAAARFERLAAKAFSETFADAEKAVKAAATRVGRDLDGLRTALTPSNASHPIPEIDGDALLITQLKRAQHRFGMNLPDARPAIDDDEGAKAVVDSVVALLAAANTWSEQYPRLQALLDEMSPALKRFPEKFRANEATLADVNDEILEWLRDPERASTFRITSNDLA